MHENLELTPEGLRIPVIPAGVADLIDALSNDDLDFEQVAEYFERFPGIVARLIALANSAWSAPSQEITTLENAVSRLGLKVSRSVAIALAVSAPMDTHRCPAFDSVHYWSDALLVADIAGLIATESGHELAPDPATARVAGLIHNIGLLVLVDNFPGPMDECLVSYSRSPGTQHINQLLETRLGFSPSGIGSRIAKSWGLPGVFEKTMSFYDDRDYRQNHWPVVNCVTAAIELTAALNCGSESIPENLEHSDLLFTGEMLERQWLTLGNMHNKTRALAEQVFA